MARRAADRRTFDDEGRRQLEELAQTLERAAEAEEAEDGVVLSHELCICREIDRQTDGQTDRQTDRQPDRHIYIYR